MDRELSIDMVMEEVIPAKEFFVCWVNLFRHKFALTDKEAGLAVSILRLREMLVSRFGSIAGMLEGRLRLYLADSMDISPANLTFLLSRLRKKGFLEGDDVRAGYVPKLRRGKGSFDLVIHFDFRDGSKELQ